MIRRGLVAPILLSVLAVADCGGSKTISHSELVAKADSICKHGNQVLQSSKISPQNLSTVAPEVAAIDRQVSSELAKLTPPEAMSADWTAIVDDWQKASEGLMKASEAAKAKQKTRELMGEAIFTKAQNDRAVTARRNGFKGCGEF